MTTTMSTRVAQARTLLFVPGHRPDRFDKAARSGADAIVVDLEDAVPKTSKAAARAAIEKQWPMLQACGVPVLVRINASETSAGAEDIEWLGRLPPPAAILLPKAESLRAVASVHRALSGTPVLPMIESAAGYAALSMLAATPGVMRLALGHLDFLADTGMRCDDEQSELAPLRFAIAMATRLNGLAPAVDGVTEQIGDEQRLRNDVRRAVRFGLRGKLCIHPAQVSIVHDAMAPTEEELAWARKVTAADAAANGGAVQVDGRMVDRPVVLLARRLLGH
jgi:citrate lyase subunit beta / citryl-CoA lyase